MSLQGLKDTFYLVLQGRIATGNAARTTVVRGVARPGVLVVENELPGATADGLAPVEAFCLRWTGLRVSVEGLMAASCEIRYATDGSTGAGGMDRGRALAAMDAELAAAVEGTPQWAERMEVAEVAGGGASTQTDAGVRVFWGDLTFGPVAMRGERMERTAAVEVFGYE